MTPKVVRWKNIKHHWEIYLFVFPTLILIGLFQYYPAASGMFHSFYRWNGVDISEYIGFDNYSNLLIKGEFWDSFKVAFILGAWNIVKMIPALLVAVCIHRVASDRMQFIYRILFVIPMVIPGLVIALIWRSFFFEANTGFLNNILSTTHLDTLLVWLNNTMGWDNIFEAGKTPAWLGGKLILASCVIWGFPWVGSFAILTYLAKLQSIDKHIYEAAEIDGASWWSKFTRIELPLIMSSIYLLLVFVIIDTVRDAGMIIALTGNMSGGPGGAVTVPALFMLQQAFLNQMLGAACAVGIILTIIVMSLQKVSTLVTSWGELKLWQQMAVRAGAIFVGAITAHYLGLPIIGMLLALVALPYNWLTDPRAFGALKLRSQMIARALTTAAGGVFIALPFLLGLLARLEVSESLKATMNLVLGPPKTQGVLDVALLVIGAALVLVSLPYRWVIIRIREKAAAAAALRGPAVRPLTRLDADRRAREAFERATDPRCRLQRQVGSVLARIGKHAIIWIVLGFAFLPLYLMFVVSLKSNNQFYQAPARLAAPYHWENWAESWDRVIPSVANSMFISIFATTLTLIFAIGAAYFFARQKMPLSRFLWNAILVLMMMPMIANLTPLFILLKDLSLLNTLTALIIVGASAGQVFSIFVLRSFVADIPQDLFEAAEIDGASHFQQIRTIVLPLAAPIIGTVAVMQFIALWNDFVLPLIVIRDHTRLPVMVELLRMSGEYIKYWGPLMAGYTIASIPIVILFVFSMRLFIRGLTEGAIKG
jgi:ABC-type glycerol-3-phosphate transport system permease component